MLEEPVETKRPSILSKANVIESYSESILTRLDSIIGGSNIKRKDMEENSISASIIGQTMSSLDSSIEKLMSAQKALDYLIDSLA